MAYYTGKWEYDVFVCFRGKDTRGLFTSHLTEHLRQRSIRTFTDEIFDRTEEIDAGLLELLERSAMSVVIFSESFAESSYCLDEVATIAQSMERFGHRVLPVFYGVEPEDVLGGYRAVIEAELKPSLEKKKRWIDGLKEVSKLAGRTSKEFRDDCELCKTILDDVLKTLSDMSLKRKPNNLVGMETQVSKVLQLLAMDGNTSNVIGLCGMGGVGKTTLARTLYHKLTPPTNGIKHHFISVDINESGKTHTSTGVDELVQQLYSTLLSEDNLSLQDLDFDHRRIRLSRLKVVVVLDNVETPWQLEQLLLDEIWDPTKLFGPGSIIIITSRNMRVLLHVRAKIHRMEGLDSVESLQLFNLHAFRQLNDPSDDLKGHSLLAVSYCKGNPLALKVLGGALYNKEKAYWKSLFSGLKKNSTKSEIHDVLSRSYYALNSEEKKLFMDVACFHFNAPKTRLIEYLVTSYESAYSVIEDLIDKSLMFTIPSNDLRYEVVMVHDLLKEIAWNIVKEEWPLPNRLRNPSDVHKLFAIREAKKSWLGKLFKAKAKYVHTKDAFQGGKWIQSLSLNLSKTKEDELYLGAKAFEGMDSLRFLGFYGHQAAELTGVPEIHLADGRLDILPNELRSNC
ncbi:Disease resistance protein RUN1 [Linum grandiflorum]